MPRVKLESVRRKSGGRIHLTPRVPRSGPVSTLCGQTLDEGTFAAFDGDADCTNCIRRSKDQGRISGAFFAQEEGSELLRLSLEQAQARPRRTAPPPPPQQAAERPVASRGRSAAPAPAPFKPVVWPAAKPPPEAIPDQLGELATRGFKPSGEGVWRSPAGVIVRLKKHGKEWRFDELVFEGEVLATRVATGIRIRAGDVEVNPSGDGYEVQLKKR